MKSIDKNQLVKAARPVRREQVAALVWRVRRGRKEVLLVTSRERKRWILPKGWAEPGLRALEVARVEAWEEAGVITRALGQAPFCEIRYLKRFGIGISLKCEMTVYSLQALKISGQYPEAHQRRRKWVTIEKAARMADMPGLAAWLRHL